jgi:hypothetical protein
MASFQVTGVAKASAPLRGDASAHLDDSDLPGQRTGALRAGGYAVPCTITAQSSGGR